MTSLVFAGEVDHINLALVLWIKVDTNGRSNNSVSIVKTRAVQDSEHPCSRYTGSQLYINVREPHLIPALFARMSIDLHLGIAMEILRE
jgi:hypothetical protein